MKSITSLSLIMAFFCLSLQFSCAGRGTSYLGENAKQTTNVNQDPELLIKDKSLQDGRNAGIGLLKEIKRVDSKGKKGGPLIYPVSLAATSDGGVVISDNNAHVIRHLTSDSPGVSSLRITGGRSSLEWPSTIKVWKDSIVVADNSGISFLSLDGTVQKQIRPYYAINSFAISKEGRLYINPVFRRQKNSDPLIVEVDGDGRRVREFGTRLNNTAHAGLEDLAYLSAADDGRVFAAFRHRPLMQVYNSNGALENEIEIAHPVFQSLAALSANEKFVRPEKGKYRLPSYTAGLSASNNHLFVLLDLPNQEIVEYNRLGEEMNRYCASNVISFQRNFGFDVVRKGGRNSFWVLTMHRFEYKDAFSLSMFTEDRHGG